MIGDLISPLAVPQGPSNPYTVSWNSGDSLASPMPNSLVRHRDGDYISIQESQLESPFPFSFTGSVGDPTSLLLTTGNNGFSTGQVFAAQNASLPIPQEAVNEIYHDSSTELPTAVTTSPPPLQQQRFSCSVFPCSATFTRDSGRRRHEATAHGVNQGFYVCPVLWCPKTRRSYSRPDKLTEHMWKAHADLGYTKRV